MGSFQHFQNTPMVDDHPRWILILYFIYLCPTFYKFKNIIDKIFFKYCQLNVGTEFAHLPDTDLNQERLTQQLMDRPTVGHHSRSF